MNYLAKKQTLEQLARSATAQTLREASQREGCPICTAVGETMKRLQDSWCYDGFTDVRLRQQLIRDQGFCALHTWQLAELNSAFPLALIYKDVLEDLLAQEAAAVASTPSPLRGWRRWFARRDAPRQAPSTPACFFCQHRQRLEQSHVEVMVILLEGEEARGWFSHSTGLCRQHMQQASAFAQQSAPRSADVLHRCQRGCLQRLLEEVEEQIRKHDYRFASDPRGNEMTAWRRAAQLCAGNRGILEG